MSTPRVTKRAISDAEPNRRRGGDLRVLLSPISTGATSGFMGVGMLEPDDFVAEHYHPYSEEFLFLVRGRVRITLGGAGGEVVELGPNESLMIPKGVRHRFTNVGDEQAFVVFHLSPLAPRPAYGHVDCEELPGPGELPRVGGAA